MQGLLISTREYLQRLGDRPCAAQPSAQASLKRQPRRPANPEVHDTVGRILMEDGGAHRRGTHRDEATSSPICFLEHPL